ncbi:hypothetical protein K449DRAFT_430053 [Hypoxylon sp. EC38]|nr:hypothetical protein K449DRAFT_430053 [Hypoxylon sp. EC38]
MSTSRVLTSTFRAVSRRAAPAQRQLVMRSTARRGYSSSSHGGSAGAEKTSDLPWLITSVAITVPAAAWLLSSGPNKKSSSSSSSHHDDDHHSAPVPDEEKSPAVESSSSESSSSSDNNNNPPTNQQPQEGNPTAAHQSGETGKQVPPPSADNSDMATDYEDKKDAQEQYKDMIRDKDTRVATSSSDVPSKKAAAEHPREDPQKGEGEGVKKGGPE